MSRIIHISIFGDAQVGKTTFLRRMSRNKFEDVKPTIIVDFESFTLRKEGKSVKVNIYDVAGSSDVLFAAVSENRIRDSDIIVLCQLKFSARSFEVICKFRKRYEKLLEGRKVLLLQMKSDLYDEYSDFVEEVRVRELCRLCDSPGLFDVSSKTGEGVNEIKEWMTDQVLSLPEYSLIKKSVMLKENNHNKKNCNC